MPNRQFAERLNQELDKMDVPANLLERINILSKLLHIPKFKAEAFLKGQFVPEPLLLRQLANELEVDENWLIGK